MIKKFFGKTTAVAASLLAMPVFAEGEATGADAIFASVDLSSVSGFIATAGVTIVGIALAMKGITLAKRAVQKA